MSINSNNKSNVKNNLNLESLTYPSEFDNFGNSAVPQQKPSGVAEDRQYQIDAGSGGDSIYAEEFNIFIFQNILRREKYVNSSRYEL